MPRYRLLLWQSEEAVGKHIPIISDPVELFTPLQKGERVILPSHVKAIGALPRWVHSIGEGEVREITHQITGAVEGVDFAKLIPAKTPCFQECLTPGEQQELQAFTARHG